MKRWYALIILLVGGLLFFSVKGGWTGLRDRDLGAQQPPAAKAEKPEQNQAAKGEMLERNPEEDRARAFLLLDGVVQEATGWNDAATVEVLAHIARLTWSSHPDYARRWLRRAVDVLTQMVDEDRYAPTPEESSLLQKVLEVAARSDPQLAQELAEKFQEAVSRREANAPPSKSSASRSGGTAPAAAQELMAYAASVTAEQPELAAQLAEMSLRSGISLNLPNVVGQLRQSHPDLAARVLAAAVNTLDRSPQATVEDVYLVQAWILNEEIGKHLPRGAPARYFDAASRILERTLNTPALLTTSAWDTYFIATELLPLYDRYAPERSAFVRSRLPELQRHPEVQREMEKEQQLQNRPRGPQSVEERLARARSAPTDAEHDTRLIGLASDLRRLGDLERALKVLAEVRDAKKRAQFQDFFLLMAVRDFRQGDLDQALTWARRIPTPTWRARALIEIAGQQAESRHREAARATLDEAKRLLLAEPKTPERALVWLFAAMVYAAADPEQGFETVSQAIIAANEVRALQTLTLTGEKVVIEDYGFSHHFVLPPPFTVELDQGFNVLAKTDFERALLAAQSLAAKEIRARAVIAVAATLLQSQLTPGAR